MSPGTALLLADVRALARRSGLHPEVVRRLIALDAVDPLDWDAAARLVRLVRLRRDLGITRGWSGSRAPWGRSEADHLEAVEEGDSTRDFPETTPGPGH